MKKIENRIKFLLQIKEFAIKEGKLHLACLAENGIESQLKKREILSQQLSIEANQFSLINVLLK